MAITDNTTSSTKIASGTTAQRPTGAAGLVRYNTTTKVLEFYSDASGASGWVGVGLQDGSSAAAAAPSGYYIAQNYPTYTSGTYWIKPIGQTTAIQMYVDMTTDGGGYDFYQCNGCTASSYYTDGHSCPGGTSWAVPRTASWWPVAWAASGSNSAFFPVMQPIYKPAGGGNYTGCIMRDPAAYGSGCADWRAPDGGKWWFRNSTYSEPNGDYNGYGWLTNRNAAQTDSGDRTYNDGGAYSTGNYYLCSTNAKP